MKQTALLCSACRTADKVLTEDFIEQDNFMSNASKARLHCFIRTIVQDVPTQMPEEIVKSFWKLLLPSWSSSGGPMFACCGALLEMLK